MANLVLHGNGQTLSCMAKIFYSWAHGIRGFSELPGDSVDG